MRVRVDLDPSLITGDGVYELALIPVSGPGFGSDMDLYSREESWSAARPRLVINGTSDYNGTTDPAVIGANVAEYVLRKGLDGRHFDDPFYSNVLSYFGILTFAAPDLADIPSLVDRVISDYNPYLGNQSIFNAMKDNVDSSVLGIVPFEIFRQRGGLAYKNEGIKYAGIAFSSTKPEGVSRLTRWWVDDMFMLGAMQSSAYENTQDITYANNAATQMVVEGQRCQQANGLGWHRNDSQGTGEPGYTGIPVSTTVWARGNGWMASGMTRTLMALPANHPQRAALLTVYQDQMAALKAVQASDGMWFQVLDQPTSYKETSATALFLYSMANGIMNGWLNAAEYRPVVDKAWDGMTRHIQTHGRVTDICWGGPSRADALGDYLAWPKVEGDNHGQGAVLLAVEAMMRLRNHPISSSNSARTRVSTSYEDWASLKGIVGEKWNDDFDADGLPNGLEYALADMSPIDSDFLSAMSLSQDIEGNGTMVIRYSKRPEAVANGDVSYVIETSPDLKDPWTPVTPDVDDDATISYTLPSGSEGLFGRLRVIKK